MQSVCRSAVSLLKTDAHFGKLRSFLRKWAPPAPLWVFGRAGQTDSSELVAKRLARTRVGRTARTFRARSKATCSERSRL